jgi:hypothetical protein
MFIVRWNGALGDFTGLASQRGSQFGVADGDVISAKVVGSVITAYKNGVQMAQATDATWATGSPGVGLNLENRLPQCVSTNVEYGFTHFTATDSLTH